MNAQRRKQIAEIMVKLVEIVDEIDTLAFEENDYFDNMPEAFQSGERGQAAEAAAQALEDAKGQIEEAIGELETASE